MSEKPVNVRMTIEKLNLWLKSAQFDDAMDKSASLFIDAISKDYPTLGGPPVTVNDRASAEGMAAALLKYAVRLCMNPMNPPEGK